MKLLPAYLEINHSRKLKLQLQVWEFPLDLEDKTKPHFFIKERKFGIKIIGQ